MSASLTIRPSRLEDLEAVTAIYAHHVRHGTGSFEEQPPPLEILAARREQALEAGLPHLVAELADEVIGFAMAAPYKDRPGYRFTVECTTYVAPGHQRRGIGRALLTEVLEACRAAGKRQAIAVVGDSGNAGSVGLHRTLEFRQVGIYRDIGFKFGRWLDVVLMQKAL